MEIRIALIRHGKTKGNLEGRYIGKRTDESLCKEGIDELSRLKDSLNSIHFSDRKYLEDYSENDSVNDSVNDNSNEISDDSLSVTYSSPMKRAKESAKILFPEKDMVYINNLIEIDFGDFENRNYEELNGNEDYQRWVDSNGRADYPGGESLDAFIKRSMNGLCEVISDLKMRKIQEAAIVCHGGNIMAIMSELTGDDYFDFQVKNAQGFMLSLSIADNNNHHIEKNNNCEKETDKNNFREINERDINLLSYSRF